MEKSNDGDIKAKYKKNLTRYPEAHSTFKLAIHREHCHS